MIVKNIYIIHWKELIDRKNYLSEKLKDYNVNWIDFFDRNTITENQINSIYKKDQNTWKKRVINLYNDPPIYRDLKISEICNSLSHIYALDHMIENNIEYGLILEDDVILKNNFFEDFDKYYNQTPNDFDMIFLGTSFSTSILDSVGFDNDKPPIIINNDTLVYEKFRNPKTRTVDAYILKKSTCEKLKNIINEISLPYDFDLAFFIKELNLKVYWWEPGLIYQGSQNGQYRSSIR